MAFEIVTVEQSESILVIYSTEHHTSSFFSDVLFGFFWLEKFFGLKSAYWISFVKGNIYRIKRLPMIFICLSLC